MARIRPRRGLASDDETAQLDAADALLQTGQFEDGRLRAENVLKKNPKNVRAQMLRAFGTAGLGISIQRSRTCGRHSS